MTDPLGWLTPNNAWIPTTGIDNVALNRIENNILLIKNMIWGYDNTVNATVPQPYFTAAVTVTLTYSIINKMVFIDIPTGFESPNQSVNLELQIEPATTWPKQIIPSVATRARCIFKTNGYDATHFERPGYMLIPNSISSNIVCYITAMNPVTGDDGHYVTDNFYKSGSNLKKAIPRQTINYMVDNAPATTTTTTTTTTTPAP